MNEDYLKTFSTVSFCFGIGIGAFKFLRGPASSWKHAFVRYSTPLIPLSLFAYSEAKSFESEMEFIDQSLCFPENYTEDQVLDFIYSEPKLK